MALKFYYKPITNQRQIGTIRAKDSIKFIVIHWTGNTSKTADALNHYKYLQHATRYGSAHYFVDSENIIQVIPDNRVAWAVGENQGQGTALNGCTNYNSISIEMCWNKDTDTVVKNTIELVKNLKKIYPKARLCRHWDVSRKDCPHGFTGNNNARWNVFLEEVKKPIKLHIDLTQGSVAREVKQVDNGWLNVDKDWYYKENGKNHIGWLKYNLNWFYFENDGKMKRGWLKYKNNWYYLDKNGYMVKGWLEYNKNKFYFNENGKMVTGKQVINGKEYMFDDKGYLMV